VTLCLIACSWCFTSVWSIVLFTSLISLISFLVGYPQTPKPVIPLVDWHKLTYLVLTCRKTPINQSINQSIIHSFYVKVLMAFYWVLSCPCCKNPHSEVAAYHMLFRWHSVIVCLFMCSSGLLCSCVCLQWLSEQRLVSRLVALIDPSETAEVWNIAINLHYAMHG